MNPKFLSPDAPIPPDRNREPVCEAIEAAAVALIEAIMTHYPEQAASLQAGANIHILTADGVGDHLFRLVDRS